MKRSISIILFAVFLFNVGGYYLVFWVLRQHSEKVLTQQLEANNYDAEDFLNIDVTISLPYGLNRDMFTKANAVFEKDGSYYRLVKYRYAEDTLHLVYLKDHDQKKLMDTMKKYAGESNSVPATSKQGVNVLSKLLTDFDSTDSCIIEGYPGWESALKLPLGFLSDISAELSVAAPPPKS